MAVGIVFYVSQGFVMENDRLRTRLMEEEISGARVKKEVERMEDEMQELQMRFEKQLQMSADDRVCSPFCFLI